MTAVILGLVAVVLLVLVVVALGMRSMNRRESALSSERLKAMAENKGPKRARPAEETFFESFPEGFDAFEEPAAKTNRTRPPRPTPRPGGRQAAKGEARGRRGVDEWGDQDDYDDDYWSRVRADEGGFGGTVHARMATPRPMTPQEERFASGGIGAVDPDAATVQAALPKRPAPVPAPVPPQAPAPAAAGLADLVEPLRAATGPISAAPAPAAAPDPFTSDAFSTGAVVSPFANTGSFGATGPFGAAGGTNPDMVAPLRATPASAAADQKTQTFAAPTPDVLAALGSQATGPQPAVDANQHQPAPNVRFTASTDAFERGRVNDPFFGAAGSTPSSGAFPATGPNPATGPFAAASPGAAYPGEANGYTGANGHTNGYSGANGYSPANGHANGHTNGYSGANGHTNGYSGANGHANGYPGANGATYQHTPPTGFPQPPANNPFETPRSGAYDASRGAYGATPATPAAPATPEPAPWSAGTPSYQPDPNPSWPGTSGVRDVLDDPEPPRGYGQQPGYDGYASAYGSAQATPYPASAPNYEVSNGWATIDDSDTLNSARPGAPSYEPTGYEPPRGYEQQPQQPAPSGGGGWPSYDELYGTTEKERTGSRRGNHRTPDTDYPDYYR